MLTGARARLGRLRRRLERRRTGMLPPGERLDLRPDLRRYEIGRYSWGHLSVTSRTPGCTLRIGRFCSFAHGCHVLLGGEHRTDFVSTYRFGAYAPFRDPAGLLPAETSTSRGDVTIGNDVWIGHGSIILSGVTLGDGVVVGAGSVVRQSVPPYAIVAGNPARVAGFRFEPEQIAALLRIRWWDWSEERLTGAMGRIMSTDVQGFIDAYDPGG
ncbi:antibiotic acetyltransferase [Pseudactinotalea sp. HY160]|uniref:CatB-related O-acetyltransferase n=1 Tax=Pseudactinotalea sp. HY160 TaxID=2654490 RepID=UPI00128DBC75|nr:CatB-related O-acetyltransferase [Pseudactinotalea sp. HY160]MPV48519.1 antibiotic acetyltransferase [Pseudactinotalea sp. HY160]